MKPKITPKEILTYLQDSEEIKLVKQGLRFANKVFVFHSKGNLIFKLPEERIDKLIKAKKAERLKMKSKELAEWVSVKSNNLAFLVNLAEEAKQFIKSQN